MPKLLTMMPAVGQPGTQLTLVLQNLAATNVKLAFNSLVVDTRLVRSQDITSLVVTVPSFELTLATAPAVPLSLCYMQNDMIQDTVFLANFTYQAKMNEPRDAVFGAPVSQAYYPPPPSDVYNGNATPSTMPFTSMAPFSSPAAGTSPFSSPYASSMMPPMMMPPMQAPPSGRYGPYASHHHQHNPSSSAARKPYHRTSLQNLKSTSHQPCTSVAHYQPYPGLVSSVRVELVDDLEMMMQNWSTSELQQGRRLVQFWREDTEPDVIRCRCRPIRQEDPEAVDTNCTVVSCIYWPERNDYYITSVDTIYLLESLMHAQFNVEEKNRIRRNLEGFRPLTVAKSKADSADFFKLVMGFPHPKPRNIEKDIKAFTWKILPYALKKIITKYSSSGNASSSLINTSSSIQSPPSSSSSTTTTLHSLHTPQNTSHPSSALSHQLPPPPTHHSHQHHHQHHHQNGTAPSTPMLTSSTSMESLSSRPSVSSASPLPTPPSMDDEIDPNHHGHHHHHHHQQQQKPIFYNPSTMTYGYQQEPGVRPAYAPAYTTTPSARSSLSTTTTASSTHSSFSVPATSNHTSPVSTHTSTLDLNAMPQANTSYFATPTAPFALNDYEPQPMSHYQM
ncbi:hypothetical protein BC940DRAFT_314994 [Gongronella butleri]|nr:hypothetical protein BC940DRAFT_314994 [Gongronella butleri]